MLLFVRRLFLLFLFMLVSFFFLPRWAGVNIAGRFTSANLQNQFQWPFGWNILNKMLFFYKQLQILAFRLNHFKILWSSGSYCSSNHHLQVKKRLSWYQISLWAKTSKWHAPHCSWRMWLWYPSDMLWEPENSSHTGSPKTYADLPISFGTCWLLIANVAHSLQKTLKSWYISS